MVNIDHIREMAVSKTDKLGMPIDSGILETVVMLNALGVNTTGSCYGHEDRITGGPYIMFHSSKALTLLKECKQITDRTNPEYKKLYNQAVVYNAAQIKKVLNLLEGFYEERRTPHSKRLIVRCFEASSCKLMCQNADLAHGSAPDERSKILQANQAEMGAFTGYLGLYVNGAPISPERASTRLMGNQ